MSTPAILCLGVMAPLLAPAAVLAALGYVAMRANPERCTRVAG